MVIDGLYGYELWCSDGMVCGMGMVCDVCLGGCLSMLRVFVVMVSWFFFIVWMVESG